MNYTITLGNMAREGLLSDDINFSTGTFKCLLMRSGFSFSASKHVYKKNLKATSGSVSMVADAATKTFTKTGGTSFVTTGFVVGSYVTVTGGSNAGSYTLTAVDADVLTVSGTIVDETASITIAHSEEYAAVGGYTQDTATTTFSVDGGELYLDDFTVSDFGQANLNASPGIVVYCDTSSDDKIVVYAKISRLKVNI